MESAPPPASPERGIDEVSNVEVDRTEQDIVRSKSNDYLGRRLRNYPSWLAYLTAFVTVAVGVYSSMAFKWQLKQSAPGCDGCPDEEFVGALFQTQLMFIGEFLALIVWYIDDILSRKSNAAPMFEFITHESELARKPTRWYFWPGASLHDFIATLAINTSLNYTYASTVQMLRNFMVVAAAFLQLIIIRKALVVHEWIGVALITVAMVLTAVPAFSEPEDGSYSSGQIVLGVCLAVGGTAIQASQLLYEEWILRRGRYPAFKAVGVEGIFGFIYTLIAWGPYEKIPVEDVTKSWYQFGNSGMLILISLLYVPGALIFNAAGLATTKLAGGLLRGVCFAVRAPLVWLVSLITKWQGYDHWNLASMLVFVFAFAIYINKLPGTMHLPIMVKPIHFCCTDPSLDGVAPGHEGAREHTNAAAADDNDDVSHAQPEAAKKRGAGDHDDVDHVV